MRHKAHTVYSTGVQYLHSLAVCWAGAGKYHTRMLGDDLQAGVTIYAAIFGYNTLQLIIDDDMQGMF